MQREYPNRRKELRFVVEAGATVEMRKTGHTIHAKTVDMSASGVLLHFEDAAELAVGDEVICEFQALHDDDKPLPYWGVGNVVRVGERSAAIQLKAGGFTPLGAARDAATRHASESHPY